MVYKRSDRTEERKDEKRKLIFETAAQIFAENGYHQTSVKDITEKAGISVGTFYLYFKNKEDLFEKLYDETAQMSSDISKYAIYEKKSETVAERFSRAVTASFWTFQKYKDLARIMLIEAVGLNPQFEKKYAELMQRSYKEMEIVLTELKKKGLVDIPDAKVAAVAFEGSCMTYITYWLRTDDKSDLNAHAYSLIIFILQALKVNFKDEDVKRYIKDILEELENKKDRFMKFR